MTDLYEFLYCSELAPDQPVTVVGQIIAQARALNSQAQVTGLLVFDGQRFCQHVEGPRKAVTSLMLRIMDDPRHVDVVVLHEGELANRRYQRFDMGLAQIDISDHIEEIRQCDGAETLKRFLELRPSFDVSS